MPKTKKMKGKIFMALINVIKINFALPVDW